MVDVPGVPILMVAISLVPDLHGKLFGLLKFGVAVYTIFRKWKWLVVNGCECRSLIYTLKF